jgi:hypothetical protein
LQPELFIYDETEDELDKAYRTHRREWHTEFWRKSYRAQMNWNTKA